MSTLNSLYQQVIEDCMTKVNNVYEIFKDQFGEENVDLQDTPEIPEIMPEYLESMYNVHPEAILKVEIKNVLMRNPCTIYVHWSNVRITNEFDKYTDIQDLWAKVQVNLNGTLHGGFSLNRSTYTYLHIRSNYMHSHVRTIPFSDFTIFQSPCKGEGPIIRTENNLSLYHNLDLWRLYCCELNNYVTVESIAGTPYHRLESLGNYARHNAYGNYGNYEYSSSLSYRIKNILNKDVLKEFTKRLLASKILKFSYNENRFLLGMPYQRYAVLASNLFIDWLNKTKYISTTLQKLLEAEIICKCICNGSLIYQLDSNEQQDFSQHVGKKVLTFKGKDIVLSISDYSTDTINYSYLLSPRVLNYILTVLLMVVNYRYGREIPETNKYTLNSSEEFI